jgi:tellurite resistance protein TerC
LFYLLNTRIAENSSLLEATLQPFSKRRGAGFRHFEGALTAVTPTPLIYWIGFTGGVLALLLFDLLVLRRNRPTASLWESLATTIGWIALAIGFGIWLAHRSGGTKGLEFFTGYLIEYALSLDNIFIFATIFASFSLTPVQQHRLLFWGVMGAMVMRGFMIGIGTALLESFGWVIYIFGAYILYAGFSMLWQKKKIDLEKKWTVRMARRFLPISQHAGSVHFMERESGQLKFTVLFLVLVIVETTDLIFALDSVPAVFGVTKDPFIVYTSNICAILGLRSLYFLLARALKHLSYLHIGLAGVLIFIGTKMLAENFYPLSTEISLLAVGAILAVAVIVSLLKPKRV